MNAQAPIEDFFVCVGAQKAGTTWLARMLSRHPDLFMTPVKEIHYFDHIAGITHHLDDRRRRARRRKHYQRLLTQWHRWPELRGQSTWYRGYLADPIDDDWYASLFRDRGGKRFAGEATPEYALIGVDGFAHMKRLAPSMRVLYILRNPVERAWSQLQHVCRREGLPTDGGDVNALIARANAPGFAAHGDYVAALDGLEQVFGPDQIRIEFFEKIHEDRAQALGRICNFIGLAYNPAWFGEMGERVNRSRPAAIPPAIREHFANAYADVVRGVEDRLGSVPQSWRDDPGAASGRIEIDAEPAARTAARS